jgi:CHASE1-domain containing sensor protein
VSLTDYAAIAVAIVTVLTGVAALLRFVVLHYLAELKPNSGSSIKDQVNRLETRVDKIYELLLSKGE